MKDRLDLGQLLREAEDVSPALAVTAVAGYLERTLGMGHVRLLLADAAGEALLDVVDDSTVPLSGSAPGDAWREQRPVRTDSGSVYVPVTVRGDALGVLAVDTEQPGPAEDPRTDQQLGEVAHLLGYLLIASERHTDRYEVGRRSESFNLPMEIQRRLLPSAFVCEGGSFTLAGWLEPSSTAGGDTFDYVASVDSLSVSLTDAVGHDVRAALLATLVVNALRNARRDGADLLAQATAAHEALARHSGEEDYATGLLLELGLCSGHDGGERDRNTDEVLLRLVDAGHPPPRLIRDGKLQLMEVVADCPFGVGDGRYRVHERSLRPGDRVALLTDGMIERSARDLQIDELLERTAAQHPRNAVQDIAAALREHAGGRPEDDATLLLLQWHGGTTGRDTRSGADSDPARRRD